MTSFPHSSPIFKLGLEKTGNKPNEVIFIDDREELVGEARNLGIHGIWFRNPKQLEGELNSIIKKG